MAKSFKVFLIGVFLLGLALVRPTKAAATPILSIVGSPPTNVRVYEKYEVRFDVQTLAENTFFQYDLNPPSGIQPGTGITVEGIFTTPSRKTLRHPGFFMTEVVRHGSGSSMYFTETNEKYWLVRFSPQEEGQYQVSLFVQDASGSAVVPVGNFTADPPAKQGFIGVGKNDTRYFEFSNGDLFWPMGPINGNNYQQNQDYGMNHARPWMGGKGAYSTNWARWISSSEHLGNEGVMTRLNFREYYSGHDLSYEIFYPEGFRMWLARWGDDMFAARLKPNTEYQIKLRLKTTDIIGPRNPAYPFGFVIKLHNFLSHETDIETTESELRDKTRVIDHININRDWYTIETNYTTPSSIGTDISLYLDNVTSGQVYVDEFSMKEVLPGGGLRGELIRNPRADQHTYVEQRPAAYFDWQVEQGEQNGVFFKYVVHDKNDWIQRHLSSSGEFVDDGDGYYQDENTKARWLLRQWYRYLIARWGYSTAIHSWELNNEGPPNESPPGSGSSPHWRTAQAFAQFMHENDSHPHLATTSFWCCWRPGFWGNNNDFPNIDYADIHNYINTDEPASYDLAQWLYSHVVDYSDDGIYKPIQLGETGMQGQYADYFSSQTDPVWWHNFVWTGLNHTGISYPNYWYLSHLDQINYHEEVKRFTDFIKNIPLNSGYYQDAEAQVSNSNLRVFGQKDIVHGGLHLWARNKNHTWKNRMDGVNIPSQSGIVTVSGFEPNKTFEVEWWNTWTGQISNLKSQNSNGNGELVFQVDNLPNDLAIRILPEGGWPTPTPTPTCAALGDVNCDGSVNFQDALMILSNFGKSPSQVVGYYDPVGDNKINGMDFGSVVKDWP